MHQGDYIKKILKDRRITQEELANQIRVSRAHLIKKLKEIELTEDAIGTISKILNVLKLNQKDLPEVTEKEKVDYNLQILKEKGNDISAVESLMSLNSDVIVQKILEAKTANEWFEAGVASYMLHGNDLAEKKIKEIKERSLAYLKEKDPNEKIHMQTENLKDKLLLEFLIRENQQLKEENKIYKEELSQYKENTSKRNVG